MNKDTKRTPTLILAIWILLTLCVQLHAASYVDPANEFSICTNPKDQAFPAIYGDIVVWQDFRNGNCDIYGKYLSTSQEFPVCTAPSSQGGGRFNGGPEIYGDVVVWMDLLWVPTYEENIYGKDLSTGMEFYICTDPKNQNSPAIYGDIVVWEDYRNGNGDIYGADISDYNNIVEFPICTNSMWQMYPAIYGDIVVWLDHRISCNAIYGKELSTGKEFPITSSTWGTYYPPAIYEDFVVWVDQRGNWDIYCEDISDHNYPKEFGICTNPASQLGAAIYGNIIVWEDYRNGNCDIYGKDLSIGMEFPVCTNPAGQYSPAIYGDIVLWNDYRNGNCDIYGNRILSGTVLQAKQFGSDRTGAAASDPINTATGNFYLNETDLAISGPGMDFEFTRGYNGQDSYGGPFGVGWTHSYNVFVAPDPCNTTVLVKWGDGQGHYYLPDFGDPNLYHPAIGAVYDKLKKNPDNSWTVSQKDQTHYNFDTAGKLTAIVDKNGNTISLNYDVNGLDQITDTGGRVIDIICDINGLVQSITDPNNRQITYDYTGNKLTSVTDANGSSEYYAYDVNNSMLKTITNRRGIVEVNNIYDPNGRVVQQINGRDKISGFSYNDPCENQTTITDPLGRETIHSYDGFYRLISITDPCGFAESYTYDNKSNRTSITDKNGGVRYFTYDDMGNTLMMTTPRSDPCDVNTTMITVITYDPNTNNPLTKKEAKGTSLQRTWVYEYDPNGNLIRTIDPNNYELLRTYTVNGLPETETDENDNTTIYTYDLQGNLTDVNDALGNIIHYTYDTVGRMLTKTDARGNTTAYSYNKNNNLLTETDPNDKAVSYTYDKNNNKTSMTDKRGSIWQYEYNENDILVREIDPCGFETIYGYDNVDNQTAVTDKRGKVTHYTYDALNRLIDVNDPLGHHTSYAYDAKGNKISQTNGLGKVWTYEYDGLDRLIKETDPLGNFTTYEYDLLGKKVAVTDAKGNRTQYSYDKLDRLIQVTDALSNITRYRYDAVGNLTDVNDADNRINTKEYDALNRLISEADPMGNTTQYQYDGVGNLITKIDAMSRTTSYEYDKLSQLTAVHYPDSTNAAYSYDENGNRIAMTDWNGQSSFEYDALNRMTAHADTFGNRVEYGYDPVGNRTAVIYPDGKEVTYEYDNAGRLVKVTDWDGRITAYSYDAADNLKSVSLPNSSQQLYDYDDAGRLISLQNKDGNAGIIGGFEYALDAVGNRVEINETGTLAPIVPYSDADYTYDDADRILTGGNCNYSFNDNGDQISRNCGNLTQYAYDPKDLLIGVSEPGLNLQHIYDGLGNRIAKTTNSTEKRYVLDSAGLMSQVLCETDASGNITAYYIYGAGLIVKMTPDGSERYYHYDGLGSTIALTDEFGYLTDQYAYTPFGELANSQGLTENSFKYVGQFGVITEPDGTLFMRARFYDPATGRFLSTDPVEGRLDNPQSMHDYLYASANPLTSVDPEGKTPIHFSAFLLGFAWGQAETLIENTVLALAQGRVITPEIAEQISTALTAQDVLDDILYFDPTLTGSALLLGKYAGIAVEESLWNVGESIAANRGAPTLISTYPYTHQDVHATTIYRQPNEKLKVNTDKKVTMPKNYPYTNMDIHATVTNTPRLISVDPKTYSQTYTSTTRKYK